MSARAFVAPADEPKLSDDARRVFQRESDGIYRFRLPDLDVDFRLSHLRRERHELIGELAVECGLPGARTLAGGSLGVTNFNLSSLTARKSLAKHLLDRSRAADLDWFGLLEELVQRVMADERAGTPMVSLRDVVPVPMADRTIEVLGIPLLLQHPAILFGDGGGAKSLLALYFAGELSRCGQRVGYLDWELDAVDHRVRLGQMYGSAMPDIQYKRCDRPLAHMRDEVVNMVRRHGLTYLVSDSIAVACDTRPEDAESAQRYMQTMRATGVGSLSIAHTTKASDVDRSRKPKPFGSGFWHHLARSTWFVRPATAASGDTLHLALIHAKANLSRELPPRGIRVTFGERIAFQREDLRDVPEHAATLPLSQRIRAALRNGPITREAIADELDGVNDSSFRAALKREIDAGRVIKFPQTDGHERYALQEGK